MAEQQTAQWQFDVRRTEGSKEYVFLDESAERILQFIQERSKEVYAKFANAKQEEKGLRITHGKIELTISLERGDVQKVLAHAIRVKGDFIDEEVCLELKLEAVYDEKKNEIPLPKPESGVYKVEPSQSSSDTFVGHGDTIVSKKPSKTPTPPSEASDIAAGKALEKMRRYSQMNAIDKNKKH